MNGINRKPGREFNGLTLLSIFLVSATLVGFQLFLMRSLSVARYHHFSYLVISTAMLGFGISGTFLSFFFPRMKRRFASWILGFYTLFVVSIPLCYLLAQSLPIDAQYLLLSKRQQFLMLSHNLILLVPFFLGAVVVGSAITRFREDVYALYAADLTGSGIGGVLSTVAMFAIPAAELPLKLTLCAFAGLVFMILSFWQSASLPGRKTIAFMAMIGAVTAAVAFFHHPETPVDPYKDLANFLRLEQQGDAVHLVQESGPRAQIDVYDSPKVHRALFAGLHSETLPPPQLSILADGQTAGTVFKVQSIFGTAILDHTPQSVPYRLTSAPKVLLLGEVGGTNIWLAKRFQAGSVTVVQTNPQMVNLMKGKLAGDSGRIFLSDDVRIITMDPRLYLEQTGETFDLIQLVSEEGMAAGVSGLQSLHENYLLTVEGISRAIGRLKEDGLLTITRGIQSPPRDNIKIFATFVEALLDRGITSPEDHLLLGRNYLAVNTLLGKSAFSKEWISKFRAACDSLLMDADYFPGISDEPHAQINLIEGPSGKPFSYFHHAAREILSGDARSFYRDWAYNISPAVDDQPYFFNFFKPGSVGRFVDSYGQHWLSRLEMGYAVLAITFLEITLVAFVLILLPLFFKRQGLSPDRMTLSTFFHFSGIGFGFMFLEMVYIQRFTKFMGDPIYSVAAALTAILVFAGLGSATHGTFARSPLARVRIAAAGLTVLLGIYFAGLDPFLRLFIAEGTPVRFVVTVMCLFPLGFFLGWFFPSGIAVLETSRDSLIPWAWGINGFTSVAAAPLGVMLSIKFGFNITILLALGCYGLVAANTWLWQDKKTGELVDRNP